MNECRMDMQRLHGIILKIIDNFNENIIFMLYGAERIN